MQWVPDDVRWSGQEPGWTDRLWWVCDDDAAKHIRSIGDDLEDEIIMNCYGDNKLVTVGRMSLFRCYTCGHEEIFQITSGDKIVQALALHQRPLVKLCSGTDLLFPQALHYSCVSIFLLKAVNRVISIFTEQIYQNEKFLSIIMKR